MSESWSTEFNGIMSGVNYCLVTYHCWLGRAGEVLGAETYWQIAGQTSGRQGQGAQTQLRTEENTQTY